MLMGLMLILMAMLPASIESLQCIRCWLLAACLLMQMTNKVAHQLFGYTKIELRGKNISILLPPIIAEQHTGYIRSYISTGIHMLSALAATGSKADSGMVGLTSHIG
jgi:hypothetical protein